MSRRENNVLSNKAFVRALYNHYDGAKKCHICGREIEQPEWHHILAKKLGGPDNMNNIIPLCHACHTAITHMKPVTKYRTHESAKLSGRKAMYPDNYEAILEDYTRCRISKSEAMERLGMKKGKLNDLKFFREFRKKNGIVRQRNNVDVYMSKHDRIAVGYKIGEIEYVDGRKEELFWGVEKPLTGESSIPTVSLEELRKKRPEEKKPPVHVHQLAKEAREEIHRQYISELSAAEKIAVTRTNRRMSESYGIDESWWQQYKQKNKV